MPGLTTNDVMVLEKIKDPESAGSPIMIDASLPPDLNLDHEEYAAAAEAEKQIVNDIKTLGEKNLIYMQENPNLSIKGEQLSMARKHRTFQSTMLAKWLAVIIRLDRLVEEHPKYASARNNRITALRGLYGDGMLVDLWVQDEDGSPQSLGDDTPSCIYGLPSSTTRVDSKLMTRVSKTVLSDLKIGIDYLTPKSFAAISPMQASRLAMLHMQRGRLYQVAATRLAKNGVVVPHVVASNGSIIQGFVEIKAIFRSSEGQRQEEASWSSLDFEDHASRDFMMAARYGNKDAAKLAVATNSNAKLCGAIVKEAMRKEYAVGSSETFPVALPTRAKGKGNAS